MAEPAPDHSGQPAFPLDNGSKQASQTPEQNPPDERFKGGSGGWGEFFRMLPTVTIPPIISVPLAPLLIAWWCGAEQLPYLDVLSDIATNAGTLTIVIVGSTFLLSLVLLMPGFVRVWEDYVIHLNGKVRWSEETTRIRNFRWKISLLVSNILFLLFNIGIFSWQFASIKDKDSFAPHELLSGIVIWVAGTAVHVIYMYTLTKTDVWPIWRLSRNRTGNGGIRTARRYFFSYLRGNLPSTDGSRAPVTYPYLIYSSATPVNPATFEGVNMGYIGVFGMIVFDSIYLLLFFGIVINLNSKITALSSDYMQGLFSLALLGVLPVFPAILLDLSTFWADSRSPWTALKAIAAVVAILVFFYPRGPELVNRLAFTLGFGGNRPVQLFLTAEAACTYPELVPGAVDCNSSRRIRSSVVQLKWMGTGSVIVHPGWLRADALPSVLPRRDVPSYHIVPILPAGGQ